MLLFLLWLLLLVDVVAVEHVDCGRVRVRLVWWCSRRLKLSMCLLHAVI